MTRLPTASCCGPAKRYISLRFDSDVIYAEHPDRAAALASYRAARPRWTMTARDPDLGESVVAVSHCPFCGRQLPNVQLRCVPAERLWGPR